MGVREMSHFSGIASCFGVVMEVFPPMKMAKWQNGSPRLNPFNSSRGQFDFIAQAISICPSI